MYTYGGMETTKHYTLVGSSEQTQFFEHEADTLQQMRDSIKPNCTPMGNSLDGLHVKFGRESRSAPVHTYQHFVTSVTSFVLMSYHFVTTR